jgi:hypothetical protein
MLSFSRFFFPNFFFSQFPGKVIFRPGSQINQFPDRLSSQAGSWSKPGQIPKNRAERKNGRRIFPAEKKAAFQNLVKSGFRPS